MQLNRSTETDFSLFAYSYVIPTDESSHIPTVLKADEFESLKSLEKRLEVHEENYLTMKKSLLEQYKEERQLYQAQFADVFSAVLKEEKKALHEEADIFFSEVKKHAAELCQATLKRLHMDISNNEKVRSVMTEIVSEYRNEKQVELRMPASYSLPIEQLEIPSDWTIIKDDTITQGACRLALDFGEVAGNFDESFNVILSMIAGDE